MITAASGTTTLTFYQDIPIRGYDPADLRALLTFAAGPTATDANDTFAVTMTSRDASNNVLDTATIAATHPAAWDRYDVGSPTSTSTPRRSVCRSRSRSRPAATAATPRRHRRDRVPVRVGDFTGQLLSDPEFGALTAWSQTVGTRSIKTATLVPSSAQYVRPTTARRRSCAPRSRQPPGGERNATAELVCGKA